MQSSLMFIFRTGRHFPLVQSQVAYISFSILVFKFTVAVASKSSINIEWRFAPLTTTLPYTGVDVWNGIKSWIIRHIVFANDHSFRPEYESFRRICSFAPWRQFQYNNKPNK
jgi:hypothetical protein